MSLDSDPKDINDNREMFEKIPIPNTPYKIKDRVGHVDGTVYEIRGIKADGLYELGYEINGNEVIVIAKSEDFRPLYAVTNQVVNEKFKKGEFPEEKLIGYEMDTSSDEGGKPSKKDIADSSTSMSPSFIGPN